MNLITLPDQVSRELLDLSRSYPVFRWGFSEWPYGMVRDVIDGDYRELSELVGEGMRLLSSEGYFVASLSELLDQPSETVAVSSITSFLAAFGYPIRVFQKYPFWRPLGVDLARPHGSSGGVGHQSFHIDFVNAETPPDLVCLLCIRPDPYEGGHSLISRITEIETLLDPGQVDLLREAAFTDGMVYGLNEVGKDINPFSVIDSASKWRYRFTSKLLETTANKDCLDALRSVHEILLDRSVSILLRRGDLLIVNQHVATHGRAALGAGQDQIPEGKRRLLYQAFVRT